MLILEERCVYRGRNDWRARGGSRTSIFATKEKRFYSTRIFTALGFRDLGLENHTVHVVRESSSLRLSMHRDRSGDVESSRCDEA